MNNNYFTKAIALVGFLTVTSALSAQTSEVYTSVAASPKSGLYLEATASYFTGDSGSETMDYFGGMAALGYRFNQGIFGHKIQVDVGGLYHDSDTDLSTDVNSRVNAKCKSSIIPVLASYNFCIPLNHTKTIEWRIGATAGMVWYKEKYETYDYDISVDFKDNVYAYGVNTGVTFNFTRLVYLDIGYRYLITGDMSGDVTVNANGQSGRVHESFDKLKGHLVTASVGFKF